jgi:CHASE2 domain-containing sensor protein
MQAKRAILTFVAGGFETGFEVLLRLKSSTSSQSDVQVVGQLPAAPNLPQTLQHWRQSYAQLTQLQSRIIFKETQITNVSYQNLGFELEQQFNAWLKSDQSEWQNIRDSLQRYLHPLDEIEVIIETSDLQIRQLPWHKWHLLENYYPNSEVSLSAPLYQMRSKRRSRTHQVKILAILGNGTNIDLEADRQVLSQLPKAEITVLVEPTRQQLNDSLWSRPWDILFFAGHSVSQSSGEDGYLAINQTDRLSIEDLKYALKRAIANGLQLALFNSCDGLGLAQQLSTLQLPHLIVMREAIPDLVAQEFLKSFLNAFSDGKSLYLSVREARERLQGLEDRFPYASWLPIICENAAARSLTWQQLIEVPIAQKSVHRIPVLLISSLMATAGLISIRQQQWLQPFELQAFDALMRLRPDEGADPRLLIVTITEADIQAQKQYPIGDRTLAAALKQLDRHRPKVLGMRIFRDFPIQDSSKSLALYFKHPRFVGLCKLSSETNKGIPAPPGADLEHQGFGDSVLDGDGVLRRNLMFATPEPDAACQASTSFGLQVALSYLKQFGIESQGTDQEHLRLDRAVFSPLTAFSGGYQNIDARGYQMLLNYRSTPERPIKGIARQVTLTQVLAGQFDPSWVRDRIVLMGVDAPASARNDFLTPYSSRSQPIAGIYLEAHAVSQILSAVLDRRSLIKVAAGWQDVVWILSWTVLGGLVLSNPRRWKFYVIDAGLLFSLGGISFLLFWWIGLWVPLIPTAIAMLISQGMILFYTQKQQYRLGSTEDASIIQQHNNGK